MEISTTATAREKLNIENYVPRNVFKLKFQEDRPLLYNVVLSDYPAARTHDTSIFFIYWPFNLCIFIYKLWRQRLLANSINHGWWQANDLIADIVENVLWNVPTMYVCPFRIYTVDSNHLFPNRFITASDTEVLWSTLYIYWYIACSLWLGLWGSKKTFFSKECAFFVCQFFQNKLIKTQYS